MPPDKQIRAKTMKAFDVIAQHLATLEKIRGLFLPEDQKDRSDAELLRRIEAMIDDGK